MKERVGEVSVEVVRGPEAVGIPVPAHIALPPLSHEPVDKVEGHDGEGGKNKKKNMGTPLGVELSFPKDASGAQDNPEGSHYEQQKQSEPREAVRDMGVYRKGIQRYESSRRLIKPYHDVFYIGPRINKEAIIHPSTHLHGISEVDVGVSRIDCSNAIADGLGFGWIGQR